MGCYRDLPSCALMRVPSVFIYCKFLFVKATYRIVGEIHRNNSPFIFLQMDFIKGVLLNRSKGWHSEQLDWLYVTNGSIGYIVYLPAKWVPILSVGQSYIWPQNSLLNGAVFEFIKSHENVGLTQFFQPSLTIGGWFDQLRWWSPEILFAVGMFTHKRIGSKLSSHIPIYLDENVEAIPWDPWDAGMLLLSKSNLVIT